MTYLYRISGGEVLGVSTDPSTYAAVDSAYYGVAVDPTTPDGNDLSVPKIFTAPSTVRNATPAEQTAFVSAGSIDANLQQRAAALVLFQTNLTQRKVLQGLVAVLVDENNILRQWIMAFKAAVAASTNLANLQTRTAALPDMPDRTLPQARTAVQAKINSGVVD